MQEILIPLFADVEDWIKLILFLLFFLGPFVTQLFKGAQGENQQRQRPRPPQPRPAPPRPAQQRPQTATTPQFDVGREQVHGAPAAPGGARGALEAEIDDFLRKSTQQVEQRRAELANAAQARPDIVEAEVIAAPPAADRSKPGRSSRRPRQRANRPAASPTLGSPLARADEKLESRLHQTFDHHLGALDHGASAARSQITEGTDSQVWEGSAAAHDRHRDSLEQDATFIRDMMRNPSDIRRVFIWSEILKRPDEREWDL